MRHRVVGRTLGRRPDQRKALYRGLATSLIDSGRIITTVEKAKELRRYVEPLITKAKKGDLNSRRLVAAKLYRKESVAKLFDEIAPSFETRQGGYTRILKYKRRQGDAAETAIIEFVEFEKKKKSSAKNPAGKKAAEKKTEAKNVSAKKTSSSKVKAKSVTKENASSAKKASTKKTTKKSTKTKVK
ncbi:MAG: 50S ribosomal protein L17 [Bdellovibrionales bacterium]|nr:50S ribosomal protein L17 [Bdellovibrionales bacterium]